MGILDSLIHLPTAEQWPLIKPLILLMQMFFLPFMGLLIVSAIASVAFRLAGKSEGLSRDLIDLGMRHPAAWLIFGLLPLISMLFLYSQYLFDQPIPIGAYLLRISGLLLAGIVLLLVYRKTLMVAAGGLGAMLLMGGMFHFIATVTLLAVPERWELVELPVPFFHSYQPIVHFKIFLAGSLLFTGAATLVAFFHWREREVLTPSAELPLVMRLAYGLLIFGIVPIPALLVVDFATAQFFTLRTDVFGLAFWMLAVLLVLGVMVVSMVMKQHTRYAWPAFVLSLVFLGLFAGRQQKQISVGNREHEQATHRRVEEIRAAVIAERMELYASASELPADAGEQLFSRVCSACHAFDARLVGPPYNEVLPKYVDDLEGMTEFILNPSRVNTDYPAMPNQGLRRAEARAVAAYLLSQFTGEPVGGEAGEEGGAGEAGEHSAGGRDR
jgi:mono/diheme cytochrome c family protein